MRLIVHAGFHKTGTSSIQQTLAANRAALTPAYRIMLKDDMAGMTEAARAYSRTLDDVEWSLFLYEAAQVLGNLDPADTRPILMSCEDLAGHMPFRHAQTDYVAAPRIMAGMISVAQDTLGAGVASLEFLFTTRAPAPWVKSCYAQHVRATRMTDDLDTFRRTALPHADLNAMVDRIAAAVAPARVHRAALEDIATGPLGPLDALLDVAEVPADLRATLAPLPPANTSVPQDLLTELLAMNRSDTPWKTLRDEKKVLIRKSRRALRMSKR